MARTIRKEVLKVPKTKPWRITTPKSIPHKNKKKYTRKAKHRKKILERLDMYIGE
jgi:hypothetical protein